ncbi:MAG: NTP transferase domain-containing protein, partial [Clostridiaceae bacterium]|nr:NTP transferase domain-containing protein [Clostridiaceae bacterium]
MKIKKAVIPAAGFGTRMLPATKVVPKEILPLAEYPAIQYLVDEAVHSGIEDIVIITSRTKSAVENYFDYAPELEAQLTAAGRGEEAQKLRELADMANVVCVRQKEMKGLGHAILTAQPFVGSEPFAVLLGDDIILSEQPVTLQLEKAYQEFGGTVIG